MRRGAGRSRDWHSSRRAWIFFGWLVAGTAGRRRETAKSLSSRAAARKLLGGQVCQKPIEALNVTVTGLRSRMGVCWWATAHKRLPPSPWNARDYQGQRWRVNIAGSPSRAEKWYRGIRKAYGGSVRAIQWRGVVALCTGAAGHGCF
jgi:hypothetical protein